VKLNEVSGKEPAKVERCKEKRGMWIIGKREHSIVRKKGGMLEKRKIKARNASQKICLG